MSVADIDLVYREHFDTMTRRYLRDLVTPALIEEHRLKPVGRHGEALGRVLAYFRRLPAAGQYLLRREPDGRYRIVAMPTERGARPRDVDGEAFDTLEAAYHGVFLRKIKDLMDLDNG